jgi:hypothetical protein
MEGLLVAAEAAAGAGGVWAGTPWRAAKRKATAKKAAEADRLNLGLIFIGNARLVANMPL